MSKTITALWTPNPGPQTAFLASEVRELLYGGAVGGGKTEALLTLALRRAHHPKHTGILMRRTRMRLQEIIDRSRQLYPIIMPGAVWHETESRWKWPNGGSLYMGYAEHEIDIEKFRSFEFDLIMFDELTEFTEYQYKFMFSRNRSKSADLPLWIRSATNPGGEGMQWVYRRFIKDCHPYETYDYPVHVEGIGDLTIQRQYIPSTVFDNPKIANREEYIAGLADMDEEDVQAMLYGRWDRFRGQYFPKAPKEVKPGFKQLEDMYVIRCLDYGWADPTCILWIAVYPATSQRPEPLLEVIGEMYGNHLTTDSIARMALMTEQDLKLGLRLRMSVASPDMIHKSTVDGGQSIGTMLQEKGLWFVAANNDRIAGWAQVLRLIARDQLRVWEGRAPNLMRTLTKLPRDPNKPNDVKAKGVEDHAAEALRYGLMAYLSAEGDSHVPFESNEERKDPYWEALQLDLAKPRIQSNMPGF